MRTAVDILKVPVFIEKADGTLAPVAVLNADLKDAAMAQPPEYLEAKSDEKDTERQIRGATAGHNTCYTGDDAGTDVFPADGSKLWKNWKADNESILILSSVGDGGDDVQASLIPICF